MWQGTAGDGASQRRGLSIGLLQLDEDDETYVLHSLLPVRMAKLGQLIGNVERVVDMNRWPAHQDRVRDLRERFTHTMVVFRQMG
jgi:hypothetical protein